MDKFPSRERSASVALEPRVSAIVVTRNTKAGPTGQSPLDLCLRSALAEPWIDDLIIVDHGNPAKISSALRALQADRRDVKLVVAPAEVSAARAANLGAEQARGRWLLFLDADVVLRRGAVARMAAAGGEAVAPYIIGGRITDPEGKERRGARGGALNAWSAIAVALNLPPRKPKRASSDEPAKVAAVSGALMLIPRGDFETLGGFDEAFAGDGADLDLCHRAAESGGSVLFQPAATGVQFARPRAHLQVQGLARFVTKSAKTPVQRVFAMMAEPALMTLVLLRDLVIGRPPAPRR